MAFTKINETIAAFRTPRVKRTIYDEINEHAEFMRDSALGKVSENVARIGVYIGIVLPFSYIIIVILERLMSVTQTSIGIIGVLMGLLWGTSLRIIHQLIFQKIPFHRLNPFFGQKIEETIVAFRKPK
jgi:hypothetical protein